MYKLEMYLHFLDRKFQYKVIRGYIYIYVCVCVCVYMYILKYLFKMART